ncbi:hypothetical protein KI387_005605 [Taxus chinensis]|uniref:Uncharacterized protein n=1 Tax=Taxus chinensis TaxID=29808 RepID=A0AA38GNX7_TAXCH|nr:hypothetical protein KI387_005605 [Taxus chinensis]
MSASCNVRSIDDINSVKLQLRFTEDQGSSTTTSNHSIEDMSAPAWWNLEIVALANFCVDKRNNNSTGREFKYAAYTDVILISRKIYLSAFVDCSTVQDSRPLHTGFNNGRHVNGGRILFDQTDGHQIQILLSKQNEGIFASLEHEKRSIFSGDHINIPFWKYKPRSGEEEYKPFNLLKKSPRFSNDNGQFISTNDEDLLKGLDLDREDIGIAYTRIEPVR